SDYQYWNPSTVHGLREDVPVTIGTVEFHPDNGDIEHVVRAGSHAEPKYISGQSGATGMSYSPVSVRYSSSNQQAAALPDANTAGWHFRLRLAQKKGDWAITVTGVAADLHGKKPGDPVHGSDGVLYASDPIVPGGRVEIRVPDSTRLPYSPELV